MTTDLKMLTATGILAAALIIPYGSAMWTLWPISTILGNREGAPPALPAWAERAQRAQRNMLENLSHFTIFVLVAHALIVARLAGLGPTGTTLAVAVLAGVFVSSVAVLRPIRLRPSS